MALIRTLYLYQALIYARLGTTARNRLFRRYICSIKASLGLPLNVSTEELGELVDFNFLWEYASNTEKISQEKMENWDKKSIEKLAAGSYNVLL
jgi:hypothetical protein